MSEITLMLEAISKGDGRAPEELLPLVYDELRRLAAARMVQEAAGRTLQPTALVHEAWLRLIDKSNRTWQNRAHFFGAAAEAMRRILIERARRKSRLKRGGGESVLDIADLEIAETPPDDKVLLVDEALERLKQENPEIARIVMLKFFSGLTNEEAAEITGVTPSFAAGTLVFSGTNGMVGGPYYVLSSTNLTQTSWTVSASGTFDGSGNFEVTNAVTSGTPQVFYRLQVP